MRDHDAIKRKIAHNVRNHLSAKDLRQAELANMLNLSSGSVNAWCMGSNYPSLANLIDMADLFNTTVGELLGETQSGGVALSRSELQVMRGLHDNGTIDDEVWYLWLNKKLEEIAQ